jgi:predicted P-loop ATPase
MALETLSRLGGIKLISGLVLCLFFSSCSPTSAPSGKANKIKLSDVSSGNFKASQRKGRKPPQLGFYQKRINVNLFSEAKHGIQRATSNKNVRHKLDNDKRTSSQNYASNRHKDQSKKIDTGFAKGKHKKVKRKHKSSDKNSDSFSTPPQKK